MTGTDDPQGVSLRIAQLLDDMATSDPRVRDSGEELVRTLMAFYGAGLARIVDTLRQSAAGDDVLAAMVDDPLVAGLLVLHDLHPQPVEQRIAAALDKVRPYLGSHAGDVDLLELDADGVVHLRLAGNCHGCPSSAVTVRLAIEQAITTAAPEITGVAVEGMAEEPATSDGHPLLPLEPVAHQPETSPDWVPVAETTPPGELVAIEPAGTAIAVGNLSGQLFAYRDACPACGGRISTGRLEAATLTCVCGQRYDLRLAGRGLTDQQRHLDPLPLLTDGDRVRVAVPAPATGVS